ncbi:MAG: hypothetical protein IJB84_04105 [Lachnospiraceae bacterium]|nr:hypothetical protein [Lachnospiraceae bacterium]
MLDREKVVLMTRMAMYEKNEGDKNIKIYGYYRNDFITMELLKAFVCVTISFVAGCGLYFLYLLGESGPALQNMDFWVLLKNVLIYYVITLIGYGLAIYFASKTRYAKMKHSLRGYYEDMKAYCARMTHKA